MLLGGLQKLTLIDYPGKIAATVFTVGCNFRCPFCHNPELVLACHRAEHKLFPEEEFFAFIDKRKKKLDGICITGGEPMIQQDILEFIRKIKDREFLVKLDTNGAYPDVLKKAFDMELVDFVAMDIKDSIEHYSKACGVDVDTERIKLSVKLIRSSRVDYEFRTTAVPGIHTYSDFEKIGLWLKGSKKYVIQKYHDEGKILDEKLRIRQKNKTINLEKIKQKALPYFGHVEIH
ncbi:MAG: anaerobic ribonucleoside-triphosphate reductase activating protein [Patescibacteria group bacterium]|nr:anaerobic ribonucleoside-triphosphate reductase activating protein [Patescibacteria group bacterium]